MLIWFLSHHFSFFTSYSCHYGNSSDSFSVCCADDGNFGAFLPRFISYIACLVAVDNVILLMAVVIAVGWRESAGPGCC